MDEKESTPCTSRTLQTYNHRSPPPYYHSRIYGSPIIALVESPSMQLRSLGLQSIPIRYRLYRETGDQAEQYINRKRVSEGKKQTETKNWKWVTGEITLKSFRQERIKVV